MSSAPADELTHAARLQRRWRGLGGVLFLLFYSLYFSAHMHLAGTTLYLKDDVFLDAKTASFASDLTTERRKAGSSGAMSDQSAFLLLHHPPARALTALWTTFSKEAKTAGRHAAATLTAGAGALTVGLLYQALLWCGVGRWRAVLFAGLAGGSMALVLFSALPQPQVFSALGLTAALAAVVRGRSGRWWEFAAAAFYATCCSLFNLVPVLLLALVRAVDQGRISGSLRPVLMLPVNGTALLLLTLSAMQVQGWIYPHTNQAGITAMVRTSAPKISPSLQRLPEIDGANVARQAFLSSMIAPGLESEGEARPRSHAGEVALNKESRPTFDFQLCLQVAWLLLLLLGLLGLPTAGRGTAASLAVLAGGIGVAATRLEDGQVLAHSPMWIPAFVFLAGIGTEQLVRRWRALRIPVTILVLGLLAAVGLHHAHFIAELAQKLAL